MGGGGGGGGAPLYLCLLPDVTGKIAKAFNVMQHLSKQPIKIRASQSLLALQRYPLLLTGIALC